MANHGNPIEIRAIDHVVLRTCKLNDMLRFYRDILGCHIERELPDLGLTQLRAGSAIIDLVTVNGELGRLGGKPPSQDGRNLDHFCLQIGVYEEAALLDYLHQHNVNVAEFSERYGAQGFGRSVYIEDPEGNVVELKAQK
ncbi:VOC family protein [Vibrio sp. PID23_8]|uniref:VOC family protein n=1 Tax=unclassified Vibrio TaxID=2614977 RepID=UPI000E67FFB7|nr:VOC family protein [Vibrio sp. PID23_8]RIZ54241.1 lactoylglutathione lyase [Vibrio sp. PID23_8]